MHIIHSSSRCCLNSSEEILEKKNNHKIDSRKQSHLDLAFQSQNKTIDSRFYYEPMLSGHPDKKGNLPIQLGNQTMKFPIWISSMTGGSAQSGQINEMLAKTAKKFGFGMGLGSCRIILKDSTYFKDFDLRPILGEEVPFYANLGISQVEELLESGQIHVLKDLVKRLSADGLIIHVNPLQEWLQPEGDFIRFAPIETIKKVLNEVQFPLIIKEVGQGFGKESMLELLKLPILAVDFAAAGGTNFSKLELFRNPGVEEYLQSIVHLGHSAEEMLEFLNQNIQILGTERRCNFAIISGGIQSFLDGHYLMSKSKIPSVYGQGSAFLKYAYQSQEALDSFARFQTEGLLLAQSFLRIK